MQRGVLSGREALFHVLILLVADVRTAEHTQEKHAHGGDAIQGERSAFRELLRGEAQGGAPEESFSQGIDRGRREDGPAGGV